MATKPIIEDDSELIPISSLTTSNRAPSVIGDAELMSIDSIPSEGIKKSNIDTSFEDTTNSLASEGFRFDNNGIDRGSNVFKKNLGTSFAQGLNIGQQATGSDSVTSPESIIQVLAGAGQGALAGGPVVLLQVVYLLVLEFI